MDILKATPHELTALFLLHPSNANTIICMKLAVLKEKIEKAVFLLEKKKEPDMEVISYIKDHILK